MANGLQMKYFVLNPAKDDAYGEASRQAMLAYSAAITAENPALATDLFDWVLRTTPEDVGETEQQEDGDAS